MIRISNVDYINTLPYREVFKYSKFIKENAIIVGRNPSGCADELLKGKADIGLVPVGALKDLPDVKLIDGFGICANKQVDSVLILSDLPLKGLSQVYLDYQSKSSNGFVKILASKYWKYDFNLVESKKGYEEKINGKTGGLVIGDRALSLKHKYKFHTDIATEWFAFSSLPAVFAVWVANRNVDDGFITQFQAVLEQTMKQKNQIAQKYASKYPHFDLLDYIGNKIAYTIGDAERESMEMYSQLLKEVLYA